MSIDEEVARTTDLPVPLPGDEPPANGERKLLGYLVKKWRGGKVISKRKFPPTAKGRRAAYRLKASFKVNRPGRGIPKKKGQPEAQDCNVIPIYEFCPEER